MSAVQNVRHLAGCKRALTLAPVLVLPLALGGITVRPALELREARREEQRLELLLDHCEARRRSLEAFGPLERLEVFDALRRRLRDLVPASLEPIEIYSHLRHAALVADVDLSAVRLGPAVDTGLTTVEEVQRVNRSHRLTAEEREDL